MRAFARVAVACLALGSAGEVASGEGAYRFEELSLEIPAQYREHVSASPSLPGSKITEVGFVVVNETGPNYAIQIRAGVVPNIPPGSDSPKEQERQLEFVAMLMDKHLKELQELRTAFGRTPARRVSLGGHRALRATWVGLRNGHEMNGVFYCLQIGAKVMEISVQGPGGRPDDTLKLALDAVDRLTIVKDQ